ncbi:MAG: hypothetical protein IKD46_08270 [Lentisphaeria bacterium]|nr:hypothetical protein [Lentisphaeria bacterium]
MVYGSLCAMCFKNSGVHGTHCTMCGLPSETAVIGDSSEAATGGLYQIVTLYKPTTLAPSERHGKSLNLLWVDGHVSNMSTNEYIQGKTSTESAANGTGYWLYAFKK